MKRNWEIFNPVCRIKKLNKKTRRNMKFFIKKIKKWINFWTLSIKLDKRNLMNLIELKRISMIFLNRLQKFYKFQISYQQDKIHQWPETTEVRILLLKLKLNTKSDLIIWELCKMPKSEHQNKLRTWRATLKKWKIKFLTNSKKFKHSKIN